MSKLDSGIVLQVVMVLEQLNKAVTRLITFEVLFKMVAIYMADNFYFI